MLRMTALFVALVVALVAATIAAALLPGFGRTWLLSFAAASGAPIGATVLLMIATLTGGRWAESWRPILAPVSFATPLAAFAFLPVTVSLPAIYPWAADPGVVPPDVARLYLNTPFFLVRAATALVGWSALGMAFGLGRPSRMTAGLGLAFHGLAVSLVAVDWFLSVEPGFTSSNFGATIAIAQIATALCLVALFGRDASGRRGDDGALLVATQIGLGYLGLMAFIIPWYGDLPETIDWYVRRAAQPWLSILIGAITCGVAVPFCILIRAAWRNGGPALRLAGLLALAGLWLQDLWIVGPPMGLAATLAAGVAMTLALGVLAARAVWPRGHHVG